MTEIATDTTDKRGTVGMIGLGAMGLPITQRLIEQGFKVIGFDTSPTPFEILPKDAVKVATSARDVAEKAEFVMGCLPSNAIFRAAILDRDGAREGALMKYYIHLGTSGVDFVESLSETLAPDVSLIDAPIIGGARRARNGTLTIAASGHPEDVAACRTILDAMSSNLFVVSNRPGAAQVMKLVNNILSSTNLAVACEALLVGGKAGLNPHTMLEVINSGTGQSNATSVKVPQNLITGRFDYGGALRIILKDSGEFIEQAERLNVPVEMARKAREAYLATAAMLGEDADMTEVIRPLEIAAGFELREQDNSHTEKP